EPFPDVSVFTLLLDAASAYPDRPAIAFLGNHVTYGRLLQEVERFSAALAGLGVRKGDRVALLLPNCPQYVVAWYACQRLGAIAVGNNPLYTPPELTHQLRDAAPRALVVLDQLWASYAAVRADLDPHETVVT